MLIDPRVIDSFVASYNRIYTKDHENYRHYRYYLDIKEQMPTRPSIGARICFYIGHKMVLWGQRLKQRKSQCPNSGMCV